MAKKKSKKQTAVLRTDIGILGNNNLVQIIESYLVVRRRLLDSNYFIEVTLKNRQKIILNKTRIEYVSPIT